MIEIIDGIWAAGETKTFHINGEYLELLDAQYPCDVFLMNQAGAQLSVMRKCEASFFSKPTGGFATVQITSADAQYLRFFVGSGDAGTRRISSTVQVVDGGRARTIGGQAFMAADGGTQVAAQYSGLLLYNPVGSGVRMVVKAYQVSLQATGSVYVSAIAGTAGLTASGFGNSKLVAGAASKSRFYRGSNAARQGTLLWDFMRFDAVGSQQKTLQEPLVALPGQGVLVESGLVNSAVNMTVEWVEESLS